MSDFHSWRSVVAYGRLRECQRCHVVAPIPGPLPIFCPGEIAGPTHVFDGSTASATCEKCGLVVERGLMPNEMVWNCVSRV